MRIAAGAGAGRAEFGLAEIAAAHAMADTLDRCRQRLGKTLAPVALAFEHVIRHALRGFLADAGQDAEGFDELV
jgi:hypothetical protein